MLVRAIFMLPVDPRQVRADWINMNYTLAGVEPRAFVVPLEKMQPGGEHLFRGIPIVTWEKPAGIAATAEQHLLLYRVTGAEYVISLGWENEIPYGPGDEKYMISVPPLLYMGSSGKLLSNVIRLKLRRCGAQF
jgi:hypothetical protein